MIRHLATALLMTLLVSGCGHVISSAERAGANELTMTELFDLPAGHDGEIILLGGVIASCIAAEQHSVLAIIPWRLDRWGEPVASGGSWEKLSITSPAVLDPNLYASGRLITLTARVTSATSQLTLREAYLWPGNRRYPITRTSAPYRSEDTPRWHERNNPYDPTLPREPTRQSH